MKTRTYVSILILILAVLLVTGNSAAASVTEDLFQAVKNGDYSEVQRLIKRGADVNARYHSPGTPLMLAARAGHTQIVKLLIKSGADVKQQGGEALRDALIHRHPNTAKFLIKAGSDVNYQDVNGRTPLMHAARKGYAGVVKLLIEAGADVNAKAKRGDTALMLAVREGYPKVATLLREAGAKR